LCHGEILAFPFLFFVAAVYLLSLNFSSGDIVSLFHYSDVLRRNFWPASYIQMYCAATSEIIQTYCGIAERWSQTIKFSDNAQVIVEKLGIKCDNKNRGIGFF
jgi:hypothetical protein